MFKNMALDYQFTNCWFIHSPTSYGLYVGEDIPFDIELVNDANKYLLIRDSCKFCAAPLESIRCEYCGRLNKS